MSGWQRGWRAILDLFLKSNCPLCDRPTPNVLCPQCDRQLQRAQFPRSQQYRRQNPPLFVWGEYGGTLKRAIAAFKYEDRPQLARPLGHAIAESWLNSPLVPGDRLTVVPIPLHREKLKARGFNQAELLARHFCDLTGLPLQAHGLSRQRQTQALFGLSPERRQAELAGALSLGKDFQRRRPPAGVLLFDDIYTSGSTCREAIRVLAKYGIRTSGIVAIASSRRKGV